MPYVLFKDDNILNKHYTNLCWSAFAEKEDDGFQVLPGFSSYKFNRQGVCKTYKGKYPKIMRFSRDENGYFFINIVNDKGERVKVRRNRAVATIFIPNPENKPEVDHDNRNRGDDRVENLSWVTECENSANVDYEAKAEKMYKRIGKFSLDGDFIEDYKNRYVAAATIETKDFINIPYSIGACAKKNNELAETEKHFTSHGYIWKYMCSKKKYVLLPGEKLIPIKTQDMDSSHFITNYFNVINKHGYKMTTHLNGGYPCVSIKINGKPKMMKMHRLVAIIFVPGRTDEKNIVNHKDENKLNYNASNLEWTTVALNNAYSAHQQEKAVDQFDKYTGKYIKTFSSRSQAAKSIPGANKTCISTVCTSVNALSCYGFVWRYADKSRDPSSIPADIEVEYKSKKKPIDQFTLKGKFVKRYDSITTAAEETGYGMSIGDSARGKRISAHKHIWRFADIDKEPQDLKFEEEKDEGQYPKLAVLQSARRGNFIKKFDNIFDAAKETNITAKKINDCCNGKYKSTGNFEWKYEQI